jgi:uncharacterized protein YjdB
MLDRLRPILRFSFIALLLIGLALPFTSCSKPSGLDSIAITPATQALTVGQTVQFTVTGTTGNAKDPSTQTLASGITWTSSSPSVATVSATGVATAVAAGSTTITASAAGFSGPVSSSATLTVTAGTGGTSNTDITSIAVLPGTQSVASPGQNANFLAIGTMVSGATKDVTSLASWNSSSLSIASAPVLTAGGNGVSPSVLVKGVNQGTATITAVYTNPDNTVASGFATFTVVGGSAEQITALQIIPNSITATSPAEQNQLIALGTEGSTGLQYDVTGQVVWKSNNAPVASICTAGDAAPCTPATDGQVTAATAGTTNITATWTNLDGSQVVAQGTYTVTIGASPEPLISINVVPGETTVSNKGMTQQYLAFGTFTTVPTIRDITDTVTWISLEPNLVSINSAGTPGEIAGLATAQGYEGLGVIYAEDTTSNPDHTLVLSNPVTFTCTEPGTTPPVCNQAVAPALLATLTVFNAGGNSTNWLITAPSDQGVPNLIHCGPGSAIAGLGNSVCTGTYAAGTNVTLTASLAGLPLNNTFGGWTANCDNTTDTPNLTATCTLPNGSNPTGLVGNQSVGALFY